MPTFDLPKGGFLGGSIRVIGKEVIEAKLAKAEANIALNNHAMLREMLEMVKAETVSNTPLGPGHFGYHLRQSFIIDITGEVTARGVLKSPATGYWREFGTGARHRRGIGRRGGIAGIAFGAGSLGSGGEPAFMTAHHALAGIRKFINFYYGGLAKWWHA